MIVNAIPVKVLAADWKIEGAEELEWDVLFIDKYLTVDDMGNSIEEERVTCIREGEVLRIALDNCKILKTRRVNYGQFISRPRANSGGKHHRNRNRNKERHYPVERYEDEPDLSESDSGGIGLAGEEDGSSTE